VLGYTFAPPGANDALLGQLVEEVLRLRREARERKDFDAADAIRARLARIGIVLEDSADGTRWHVGAPDG